MDANREHIGLHEVEVFGGKLGHEWQLPEFADRLVLGLFRVFADQVTVELDPGLLVDRAKQDSHSVAVPVGG